MDITTFSDQLKTKMKDQLDAVNLEEADAVVKYSRSLATVRSILDELKGFVVEYEFTDLEEEVKFFKEIKPLFVSQYLYYDKIINLKLNEPGCDVQQKEKYYSKQMERLQRFQKKHLVFYRYCLSGETGMDEKYFTRDSSIFDGLDIDSRFSTGYDNRLGQILANILIIDFLNNAMRKAAISATDASLTWTGSKTDLTELIYALHSAGVFNNSNADVKQIARTFEDLFQVSLGNYYRTFQEIRLRKKGRTNFVDELRQSLINRIESSDGA